MDNPTVFKLAKALDLSVSPYNLVMHRQIDNDEHVVMVGEHGRYAVCRIFPGRGTCQSPNYHVPRGTGLLHAPLTPEGLSELLHWTDRKIALKRFVDLVRVEAWLSLVPQSAR